MQMEKTNLVEGLTGSIHAHPPGMGKGHSPNNLLEEGEAQPSDAIVRGSS